MKISFFAVVRFENLKLFCCGLCLPVSDEVPEMKYCEMSLLYFELDIFCQFEAGVPEFDAAFSVQCTIQSTAVGRQGLRVKFWDSSLK
jgi:hypothetical protein